LQLLWASKHQWGVSQFTAISTLVLVDQAEVADEVSDSVTDTKNKLVQLRGHGPK
uniref:Phospholipid-transporting ATPase IIB n=1 Tax=Haemonchus placei TaxID=6290 RepID=A0A0N4X034_HAEPC